MVIELQKTNLLGNRASNQVIHLVAGIQTRNSREISNEIRVWIPATKRATCLDRRIPN